MTVQTKQADQIQSPTPQQAYDFLFRNLHAQVFVEKLASYGINPQTEDELAHYMELAGKLRQFEDQATVKQASAHMDLVKQANQMLNEQLGIPQNQFDSEEEAAIKSAAARVIESPDIFNSILTLKFAEAQRLFANQQG